MEIVFALLVGGCGLAVALTIGAVVLLKMGVLTKYAIEPERPEDKLGDYGLDSSREVGDGAKQVQGESSGSD